jgi:hypothetical protein
LEKASITTLEIIAKLVDQGYTFKAYKAQRGYVVEYRSRYSAHTFEIEDDDLEEAISRLWSVLIHE